MSGGRLSNNIGYRAQFMSEEQKEDMNQRRHLSNFKRQFWKWKNGQAFTKPKFYKDNRYIRVWLASMNINPDKHYGHSDICRAEKEEANKEAKRRYYEREARRDNGRYQRRKKVLTDQEVLQSDYWSLSDDDKLRQHELFALRREVAKGERCLLCRMYFTEDEMQEGNELRNEVVRRGHTFYIHSTCHDGIKNDS